MSISPESRKQRVRACLSAKERVCWAAANGGRKVARLLANEGAAEKKEFRKDACA